MEQVSWSFFFLPPPSTQPNNQPRAKTSQHSPADCRSRRLVGLPQALPLLQLQLQLERQLQLLLLLQPHQQAGTKNRKAEAETSGAGGLLSGQPAGPLSHGWLAG